MNECVKNKLAGMIKTLLASGLIVLLLMMKVAAVHANRIDERGELVIGMDHSFAPYGYIEDGEYKGFDVELAQAVMDKMGLNYRFQSIDWSVKEMELIQGNIDMIWNGYTITPEREQLVTFSDTYLTGQVGILVPTDSSIQTKADLKGKKVATQEGSMQLEAMMADQAFANSLGEIVTFATFNEVLQDLSAGRVDAIVIAELPTRYYFAQNGRGADFRMLDEGFGASQVAVGFRKEDADFVQRFNQALAQVRQDGTYDEIMDRWFAQMDQPSAAAPSLLAPLLAGSKTTLFFFAATLLCSIPLGLFIALLERRAPRWLKALIRGYIYLFRGTPLLLQIMFIYFGLPYLGWAPGRVESALFTMVINYAAYLAEIFRGGLNAIPAGQYEALQVLSVDRWTGLTKVILPQVWRTVMPSVGNEVISLVKDTSLIYVIGLDELSKVGRSLSNQYASMLPFVYVGLIYLALTGVVTLALRRIEKRLDSPLRLR